MEDNVAPIGTFHDFGRFFESSRIVERWLKTQSGRKTQVGAVIAPLRQMPPFWLNIWNAGRTEFQHRAAHFKSDIVCAVAVAYSPATFCLWDVDSPGGPWPGPISGATAHEVAAVYWQLEQWCVHRYFGFFDPRDPKDTVLTTELLDFFQTWPVIPSELLRLAAALERERLALCKFRGELPSKFESEHPSEQDGTPKAANPENEARDRFIYERAMTMVPWGTIVIELKERCKSEDWTEIETPQGVRERAFNYAKRHQLAEPPSRQDRSP
jgi:hypothetical protein